MILQRTQDIDAVRKRRDDYRRDLDEQVRLKNQMKPGQRNRNQEEGYAHPPLHPQQLHPHQQPPLPHLYMTPRSDFRQKRQEKDILDSAGNLHVGSANMLTGQPDISMDMGAPNLGLPHGPTPKFGFAPLAYDSGQHADQAPNQPPVNAVPVCQYHDARAKAQFEYEHHPLNGEGEDNYEQQQRARKRATQLSYHKQLDDHIRMQKERVLSEKRKERQRAIKEARSLEDYNPWGKGGAGAPYRNDNGEIVADFKKLNSQHHSPTVKAKQRLYGNDSDTAQCVGREVTCPQPSENNGLELVSQVSKGSLPPGPRPTNRHAHFQFDLASPEEKEAIVAKHKKQLALQKVYQQQIEEKKERERQQKEREHERDLKELKDEMALDPNPLGGLSTSPIHPAGKRGTNPNTHIRDPNAGYQSPKPLSSPSFSDNKEGPNVLELQNVNCDMPSHSNHNKTNSDKWDDGGGGVGINTMHNLRKELVKEQEELRVELLQQRDLMHQLKEEVAGFRQQHEQALRIQRRQPEGYSQAGAPSHKKAGSSGYPPSPLSQAEIDYDNLKAKNSGSLLNLRSHKNPAKGQLDFATQSFDTSLGGRSEFVSLLENATITSAENKQKQKDKSKSPQYRALMSKTPPGLDAKPLQDVVRNSMDVDAYNLRKEKSKAVQGGEENATFYNRARLPRQRSSPIPDANLASDDQLDALLHDFVNRKNRWAK